MSIHSKLKLSSVIKIFQGDFNLVSYGLYSSLLLLLATTASAHAEEIKDI
jgi:hypothetical protein